MPPGLSVLVGKLWLQPANRRSYLRSFPFNKIKIGRSFVKDIVERTDCVAIVDAISGLGRSLNT
jgi:predicted signal transduction protein with EAL and GGDEF domain